MFMQIIENLTKYETQTEAEIKRLEVRRSELREMIDEADEAGKFDAEIHKEFNDIEARQENLRENVWDNTQVLRAFKAMESLGVSPTAENPREFVSALLFHIS